MQISETIFACAGASRGTRSALILRRAHARKLSRCPQLWPRAPVSKDEGGPGWGGLVPRDASQSSLRRLRKLVCAAAQPCSCMPTCTPCAAMLLGMRPGESRAEPTYDSVGRSVDVLLVAALPLEVGDEGDRLVDRARAVLGDDVDQRALDVAGHALGVAADIDVGAVGEPGPEIAADLAHPILDVELLLGVARPGEREPGQRARGLHAGELVLVEEVVVAALMPEEQPVAAGRLAGHALVEKGAERRDAGAGADHDDRHRGIGGEAEMRGLLHIDLDP